jgi:hypothetical protein
MNVMRYQSGQSNARSLRERDHLYRKPNASKYDLTQFGCQHVI